MTEQTCVRPKGFDLASFWEQSALSFNANLPQYQTTVRVYPDIFPLLRYAGRFARIGQASEPDAEGGPRGLFSSAYERLSNEALKVERKTILKLRDELVINDEVLRRIQRDIDLAEARLGEPEP